MNQVQTASSNRAVMQEFDDRIAKQTERNIQYYAAHPEEIDARLEELDREWDVERTLETHAAAMSLASVVLGTIFSRRLLYIPALVGGMLLRHSLQGAPWPVLRRFGVRTQQEIERERYALKALRGDFDKIAEKANDEEGEGKNVVYLSRRVIDAVK